MGNKHSNESASREESAPPPPPPPEKSKRHMATPSYREGLIGLHAQARKRVSEQQQDLDSSDEEGDGDERQNNEPRAGRLRNIFAAPIEVDTSFAAPVHPKSDKDEKFVRSALEGNFVFDNLGDFETDMLVNAFEKSSRGQGEKVIVQGEVGDYFYIIHKGSVAFEVDGAEVGTAKEGNSFGELALLYDCPRAATCITSSPCELWRVDQKTFRKILASGTMRNDGEVRDILRKVPFLKDLDVKYLNKISEALNEMKYSKGEKIVTKGEEGSVFYVIKEGKVKVHDIEVGQSKYDDQELSSGGYFGERAIVMKDKRVANVTALEDCTLLCLSKDDFEMTLGPLADLIIKTADKGKLKAMPLFENAGVRDHDFATMADLVEEVDFPKGHTFFAEGEAVSDRSLALFIVRKGTISIASKEGETHTLSVGGYFGDDNIRPSSADVMAKNTATAEEDCRVGLISLHDIESVVGNIQRLHTAKPKKIEKVKFSDLKKHRILGVGTFGKVWLVSKKSDKKAKKETFALKIQNKMDIIQYNQVDGVIREKNVMELIDSPFVIRLINTYQDDTFLYILQDLVQGGELFSVLHTDTTDGVSEKASKFYAANILEGLSHMHNHNIIYRDLKPENVLVDAKGYNVIIDLGFAKIVMDKTYTLCGTPLYLAPEVILSRGHDKGADYWSWGVLIYEMIDGVTPFYADNIDQMGLFKKIVRGKYDFSDKINPTVRDLVTKLLAQRSASRLGCLAGGDKDIRQHEWFADFDFNKLMKKELEAPWVPKLKDPFDTANFDNWDHEDKPPPKQRKLTKKEQKRFEAF